MGGREADKKMKHILVTGGGGFVGGAIVRMAISQGIECSVIGRNSYPAIQDLGARCLIGDIRDFSVVAKACRDVDTVFHVAALAGIWGDWQDYYQINVLGTENIIRACRENGVPNLVYTSTPSVVFNKHDITGGDESLPYATRFLCHYARSKVMAEKLVLAANDRECATCALRPHLIWGPGDPHLLPRLLVQGKKKKLKIVGSGMNMVDISFIDNVAHAHLLAGRNLSSAGSAAGKAYFISQGQPVNLWQWINEVFVGTGIEPLRQRVPFSLAYWLGAVLEGIHGLTAAKKEPRMTRFVAEQLAKSHYFSIKKAEKDLGYAPLISTERGIQLLIDWIKNHEKDSL
jgi:2-alkyl-3-oxoalkanoate reductase